MNFKLERILVIIGAIVIIGLAIGLPFLTRPSESLLPNFALSQLAFSAVAFFILFLTLYFTIVQLRKSMAKPQLKLHFGKDNNEFGENDKTSIEVYAQKDGYYEVQLYLWIKNTGNSVAKTFQIEIEVPSIFDPTNFETKQGNLPSKLTDNGNIRIYTRYNTEKICFVNKPEYIDDSIILGLHSEKYDEYKKDEYEIRYRVFGDWSETQEDKLKVIVKK